MKMYSIFLVVIIFTLCSSHVEENRIIRSEIIGHWSYSHNSQQTQVYYRAEGFNKRGFAFKKNQKSDFQRCTDRCGCLPIKLSGKWKWETDSLIVITYNNYNDTKEKFIQNINLVELKMDTLKITIH